MLDVWPEIDLLDGINGQQQRDDDNGKLRFSQVDRGRKPIIDRPVFASETEKFRC